MSDFRAGVGKRVCALTPALFIQKHYGSIIPEKPDRFITQVNNGWLFLPDLFP